MNADQVSGAKRFMGDPTFQMGFLATLETLLNRTLSLDPVTLKKLQALQGKVIAVHCIKPVFQCYVFIESQGVRLSGWHEGDEDASLCGSTSAFFQLTTRRRVPFKEIMGLETRGSEELLTHLEHIHSDMELDWESLFCRVLGDVGGHAAAEGLRSVASRLGLVRDTASGNLGGYLQEELKLLPSAAEIRGFGADLESLRQDLESLEKRVSSLAQNQKLYKKTGE